VAPRRRAVVWAESAQRGLDEVITYIARDSREQALRVLEAALDSASSLHTLAERGRVVPEFNEDVKRELFVFRYRLIYEVSADQVIIQAFLHGSRDFAKWRDQQS
jgi:plasmid stabilization system protein ParE